MTPAAERLYALLPAVYRARDAAQGEPLKALLAVVAEQVEVLERDLDQLYDDQFIETCSPWVAAYIGDLVGYRPLHGIVPRVTSPRSEVANTIGYRRRKGTAVMLEQLARDVTGWHACVVEFFRRLTTTQHMNHVRPANRLADLRRWEPLHRIDSAFDQLAHTADMRRIEIGRGRYNIPNVGIFLWRLNSYPLTDAQPFAVDARRYRFNPLGIDQPLFTRPTPKAEFSGLSTPLHVPDPIARRVFKEYLRDYFGSGKSISLSVAGRDVPPDEIIALDLSDIGGAWAQSPETKIGIDPVLGRIAFPSSQPPPHDVRVTFHSGYSSAMGGGEYDRAATIADEFTRASVWQIGVSTRQPLRAGEIVASLSEALEAWHRQPPGKVGVIALLENETLAADLDVIVPATSRLLIVGAEWAEVRDELGRRRVRGQFTAASCRPHLRGDIRLRGADDRCGRLVLNGLLIEGALDVAAIAVEGVSLQHCTLVPGRAFTPDGYAAHAREPSLTVAAESAQLTVDHSIVGGLRVSEDAFATITDSIVDATSRCGVAYSGLNSHGPGGTLRIENSTVIGKVHTVLMKLASNTIFFSCLARHDAWKAPVLCARRQSGCVRFCFVPLNARTPHRFQCHPANEDEAARVTPQFTSLNYGDPGYAQLSARCAAEIFRGADDESEMGAFHELFEPQRIRNLEVRLDEYLRFGLEAGIIFEPKATGRRISPNVYAYPPWVDLCGDTEPLPGMGSGLI